MADDGTARYVRLREEGGQFIVSLLDGDGREIGHGYKGPTQRRAEQDLKYWTKTKGLEQRPA